MVKLNLTALGGVPVTVKLFACLFEEDFFWRPISCLVKEKIDFEIYYHNENIKERLKREDNGEGQEQ